MSDKRKLIQDNNNDGNSSSSDDDDFGPMPASESLEICIEEPAIKKTKVRSLKFENIYLDNLPSAEQYEHSYMHRDVVTHIAVAKSTDFIITGSYDGHVKFWKKMAKDIEFVKHYHAHLGPITSLEITNDGQKLVTTSSEDSMIKFFDIQSFDMANMISANYKPTNAVWLNSHHSGHFTRVAIADADSGIIRIYKSEGNQEPVATINLHSSPVKCMVLNVAMCCVISADSRGVLEYWDVDTCDLPIDRISFKYKTETDLYDLAKKKTTPCSIAVSQQGNAFATTSRDKQIRVFDFSSGKLRRQYDETNTSYQNDQAKITFRLDNLEMGRKLAMERELESHLETLAMSNLTFDDSGNFLMYSSLPGIKILNLVTNRVVRTLGTHESGERFLAIALYQGVPKIDAQFMLARAGRDSGTGKTVEEINSSQLIPDPTIYCTSFKRRRFYCFSKRNPDESEKLRDVLNEKPTEEEKTSASNMVVKALPKEVILRTTLGDIHIKLFSVECPRTVENFTTHARNNYYDNVIFHRVIKGFMIQTGDPLGDGTGGESIWGGEFEDEFDRTLRHDRPYTVSMANCGPNTNGSQFFITTAPYPSLDNKHTVFGRVTDGFEVVSKIEERRVDKNSKPMDGDIKILSVEVIN